MATKILKAAKKEIPKIDKGFIYEAWAAYQGLHGACCGVTEIGEFGTCKTPVDEFENEHGFEPYGAAQSAAQAADDMMQNLLNSFNNSAMVTATFARRPRCKQFDNHEIMDAMLRLPGSVRTEERINGETGNAIVMVIIYTGKEVK